MNKLFSQIDKKKIPSHVAVIMDGNGRWAKKKGFSRSEGHNAGSKVLEKLMDTAIELNIKCISVYAFSTENWSRPKREIDGLWKLFTEYFDSKLPIMLEKGIRIHHSGSYKKLPAIVKNKIITAVDKTKNNKKITLNFCLNYGSRQEILEAVNEWAMKRKPDEKITASKLEKYLYTSNLPDVDLLIRTSGESRISNFLLWQIAYSEIIFMNVLWPDFNKSHLYKAIIEYQKRDRRYGGI